MSKSMKEPSNIYEFCQAFSQVTGLPTGKFLKESKGWPYTWFFDITSACKMESSKEKKAIVINSFFKKYRESLHEADSAQT